MSALSDYIHLHRENYLEHGTFRNTDNNSNDGKEAFQRFANQIQNRATHYLNDETRLRQLEETFNEERKRKIEALKILAKTPADYTKFIEAVLKAAELKKFNPNDIAKWLTVNENNNTLKLNEIFEKADTTQRITIPNISSKINFSYIDTLLSHIKIGHQMIKMLQDQNTKNLLRDRLNFLAASLYRIKQQALKEGNSLRSFYSINDNKITGLLGEGQVFLDKGKVAISAPMNRIINNEIISISKTARLSSVMSNILGATEEVLGTIGAPLLQDIANETMDGFLNNIKYILNNQNITKGQSTSSMNFKIDDIVFNKYELQKDKYKNYVTKLADGTLTLELNYDTKNKADFSISVDGNNIGVSSKAIDLSKTGYTNKKGEYIPAQVTLQSGTNLLAYLLKAQEIIDKTGTHFLNAYATGSLTDEADKALTIFLVYTALTGDILKKEGNAGLLYIYDTSNKLPDGSNRVHFFSIGSIIQSLLKNENPEDVVLFSPSLQSISQELQKANEEVDPKDWELEEKSKIGAAISARHTKVLGEARLTILSIALTNDHIRSLINNKIT